MMNRLSKASGAAKIDAPTALETSMQFQLEQLPLRVRASEPLNIVGGAGATIRVLRGRVWITQEGSPDDVFVDAGGTHQFEGDGKAIVSAEGASAATAVLMFDAPLSIRASRPLSSAVHRWVRRLMQPAASSRSFGRSLRSRLERQRVA